MQNANEPTSENLGLRFDGLWWDLLLFTVYMSHMTLKRGFLNAYLFNTNKYILS